MSKDTDTIYRAGVEWFGDTKNLDKSFKSVNKKLTSFSKSLKFLGRLFGIGFSGYAIKKLADMGKQMSNLATQTGLSVSSLSAMSSAFMRMGSSANTFSRIAGKMNQGIFGLAMGNPEVAAKLASMGIASIDKSGNFKSSEQLMMEVANWAKGMKDRGIDSRMIVMALEELGFDAASAQKAIYGGAGALYAEKAQAKSLGLWMSDKQASNLKELSKSISTITEQFKYLAVDVVSPLAELANPAIEQFSKYLGEASNALKNAKNIIAKEGDKYVGKQSGVGDFGKSLGRKVKKGDFITDFGNGYGFDWSIFKENLELPASMVWSALKAPFEAVKEAGNFAGTYIGAFLGDLIAFGEMQEEMHKRGYKWDSDNFKYYAPEDRKFIGGMLIPNATQIEGLKNMQDLFADRIQSLTLNPNEPIPVTGELTINMVDSEGNMTTIPNSNLVPSYQ